MREGIFAEFATPVAMVGALRELRERGYERVETFGPYELVAAEAELEQRSSRLPWVVFVVALLAAVAAYVVQWYTNAVDYPLNAGGRPAHAPLAFVYVTFEVMVLVAALAVFFGFLISLRFPEPWHPLFEVDGFEAVSTDRFGIGVDRRDARYDPEETVRLLRDLGASRVSGVREEP